MTNNVEKCSPRLAAPLGVKNPRAVGVPPVPKFFDLTKQEHGTPTDGTGSKHLRAPPKLVIGDMSESQRQWLAGIRLNQRLVWLRHHTSCQTIICPIEADGQTRALLAKIEGKGKTGITVKMDVSNLKKIKLAKCPPAWQWQVEIAEAVIGEFITQALNAAEHAIEDTP